MVVELAAKAALAVASEQTLPPAPAADLILTMTASTQSLRSLVFAAYRRALNAGALHFSETEIHNLTHNGINYQIRYAPNLLKKPISATQPPNPSHSTPPNPTSKSNPFLPPNPALYITSIPRNHFIVLNKFPVIPGHFILATNDFQQQSHPLAIGDMEAILSVLKTWDSYNNDHNDDNDTHSPSLDLTQEAREHQALYGFFNSGRESGASQPHRHVQFIPLTIPELNSLWATHIFTEPQTNNNTNSNSNGDDNDNGNGVVVGRVGNVEIRYQSKITYKHYFTRIPQDSTPEGLWKLYTLLLTLAEYTLFHPTTPASEVINAVNEVSTTQRPMMDEDVKFSYNLAFTKDWIGVLPRVSETVHVLDREEDSGVEVDGGVGIKCPGLNLNGTVMAGMTLIRTRKEMDVVLQQPGCIARTMGGIGVPQHTYQQQ
ncbi:ADP-sulfurylase [Arthrobotrys entomopaga]|nr:ADP-sulfurylase [Arthrobotrys entomopaga]